MCGEHRTRLVPPSPETGSSPHVRGARAFTHGPPPPCGIIPACAGSTRSACRKCRILGDHPRMCGEHCRGQAMLLEARGSSPHVRGALLRPQRRRQRHGIIPACAGSTSTCSWRRSRTRDHPRMCGEHNRLLPRGRTAAGSSPHVRGALQRRTQCHLTTGIIPACAGSTITSCSICRLSWDHPRMCGEHKQWFYRLQVHRGSSPHVRGAPDYVFAYCRDIGIIPACAGSTERLISHASPEGDHPRMCGEHTSKIA